MIKTLLRRRFALPSPLCTFHVEKPSPFKTEILCAPYTSKVNSDTSYIANRHEFRTHRCNICAQNRAFAVKPSHEASPSCWNCSLANAQSDDLPFLVCHACRAVQPLNPSIDYFHMLGLQRKCEIGEGDDLEGKYKMWQKQLHPDLVHSKSQKEKEFAAEQSARVIEAYRTLSNPLSRAIYILKLEGVDVDEEETVSDPELLSEIMEIREAVEEAPDSKSLMELHSQMQQSLQQWFNSFTKAFQSRNFEEALMCIRRMTYYDRVHQEIVKRL